MQTLPGWSMSDRLVVYGCIG